MPLLLVVLEMKALIVPQRVSTHLVQPFEVWLILDLLQNLIHWFSEHSVNPLRWCKPSLPSKILPGSVIVVTVRPEISNLLKDSLTLSLALLLVLLDLLILINPIHELAHTSNRFSSQRLPARQVGRPWKPDSYIIKVTIYLIKHLPVSVQICF